MAFAMPLWHILDEYIHHCFISTNIQLKKIGLCIYILKRTGICPDSCIVRPFHPDLGQGVQNFYTNNVLTVNGNLGNMSRAFMYAL